MLPGLTLCDLCVTLKVIKIQKNVRHVLSTARSKSSMSVNLRYTGSLLFVMWEVINIQAMSSIMLSYKPVFVDIRDAADFFPVSIFVCTLIFIFLLKL
jgi:hypothetical protein